MTDNVKLMCLMGYAAATIQFAAQGSQAQYCCGEAAEVPGNKVTPLMNHERFDA